MSTGQRSRNDAATMPNCHICGKSDLSMLCVCGECREPSKATNADKIRAMSDEELAAILVAEPMAEKIPFCQNSQECDRLMETDRDIPEEMCAKCMLAWLRQSAEEG